MWQRERWSRFRFWAHGLVCALQVGCWSLEPRSQPSAGGLTEPDVFDVIRASNSHAVIEHLRDQYRQEVEQARILEDQIAALIAAEEALSIQRAEEEQDVKRIRDTIDRSDRERDQLERKLGQSQKARDEKAQAVSALEAELGTLGRKESDLQAQRDKLRAEVEAVRQENEALRETLRDLKATKPPESKKTPDGVEPTEPESGEAEPGKSESSEAESSSENESESDSAGKESP